MLLHGYSLTQNSLPRHQSLVTGNDDRFGGSRHGFESGYVASRNDDDEGFEIDVGVTETSLAMNRLVVTNSSRTYPRKFLLLLFLFSEKRNSKMTDKGSGNLSRFLP